MAKPTQNWSGLRSWSPLILIKVYKLNSCVDTRMFRNCHFTSQTVRIQSDTNAYRKSSIFAFICCIREVWVNNTEVFWEQEWYSSYSILTSSRSIPTYFWVSVLFLLLNVTGFAMAWTERYIMPVLSVLWELWDSQEDLRWNSVNIARKT